MTYTYSLPQTLLSEVKLTLSFYINKSMVYGMVQPTQQLLSLSLSSNNTKTLKQCIMTFLAPYGLYYVPGGKLAVALMQMQYSFGMACFNKIVLVFLAHHLVQI